jgi:hypothetical protein
MRKKGENSVCAKVIAVRETELSPRCHSPNVCAIQSFVYARSGIR